MDFIVKENVKIPNAVLVSGITNTEVDEEIFDFLKKYGSISRVIKVPSTDPELQVIVEYEQGTAVEALEANFLPYRRTCTTDPKVVHHVQSLANVYTSSGGTAATDTYLSGLKDLAKLSGRSFEDILQEELARISETVRCKTPSETSEEPVDPEPSLTQNDIQNLTPSLVGRLFEVSQNSHESQTGAEIRNPSPLRGERRSTFHLPSDQLSPPEVQRVVVEHIVKSGELASQIHSSCKLKFFSGRLPQPNFEVDYDTWRSGVEFSLKDPSISDSQMVRKIVESLSPPAANVVKSLGPQASPKEYLNLLDSAYATVEDGDELFARFLNTNQNTGEKASDYLQRLHTALGYVVNRGGIAAHDSNKQLLKQFCRGCWNSTLITSLQLEQRKSEPPSFAEFLLLLRTEEDKQTNKASRMKQHLGFTRPKVMSNMQSAYMSGTGIDIPKETEDAFLVLTSDIKKQIAELQAQVAKLSACNVAKPVQKKVTEDTRQKSKTKIASEKQLQQITATTRPKPWYCFRCGEDGHIASTCNSLPNPTLVQAKKTELRQKQRAWEVQNCSPTTPNLN
ncbi:hypothetical protein PAMA_011534 [Pampus argenteus]